MKSLKKAATVSFSGFICAMGLTACGKFEALEGQKLVMDPPVEKLVLPQNISEELGEALFVAVEKNGATELGQAAKQDMGQFLGLFDTLGREKIKGISVMKTIISQVSEEDSTVNQEFAQLQVQIFQRAMGRNIELYFDGTLPVGSEKQSLKMVELQASEDNEDIVSYLKSCDQKFSQFSSSLQKDNVFNIKVFAS